MAPTCRHGSFVTRHQIMKQSCSLLCVNIVLNVGCMSEVLIVGFVQGRTQFTDINPRDNYPETNTSTVCAQLRYFYHAVIAILLRLK